MLPATRVEKRKNTYGIIRHKIKIHKPKTQFLEEMPKMPIENFGSLEYVLDKYSRTWSWKVTGYRAVRMVSRLISQSWYGDGPDEAIVADTSENIQQIKWILERYPLEILSKTVWQKKVFSAVRTKQKSEKIERLRRVNPAKQFRGKLLNFQKEGLDFLLKSDGNALLADEMGLGKCLEGSSKILTSKGRIKIQDLWDHSTCIQKDGNESWGKLPRAIALHTFDGKKIILQKTDKIFRQKVCEPLMEVTLADGHLLRCTKRHKFLTPKGWKSCSSLSLKDNVACIFTPDSDAESQKTMEASSFFESDSPKMSLGTNQTLVHFEPFFWHRLDNIQAIPFEGFVYDLEVPQTHNYIANGIISHNTVQTLAYTASEKHALPVCVIAPLVTLKNWQREISKFMKRKSRNGRIVENEIPSSTIIRNGKSSDLGKFDFYIINYELLDKRLPDLSKLNIKTLVCDEVQNLRSKSTKKYSAVRKLAALESVKHRIGLSGTPIYNRGSEIWPIVDILRPGMLGSFKEFCEYFCYVNEKGKAIVLENKRESLRKELQKHVMLRRKKSDVLKELKDKVRYKEVIDSDTTYYLNELDKIWKKLEKEQKEAQTAFDKSSSYQRAIQSERQAAGVAKLPHVINFVKNIMEIEESVVVFCHHKAIHQLLHESLKEFSPVSIIGGQSDKVRQEQIDLFQNGGSKLMIAGLRAGNLGINLSNARYVIFAELDWSPAIHRQGEDRCIAKGQLVHVLQKGLIPIEAVRVGDKVLTHTGSWKKVTDVFERKYDGFLTQIWYEGYDEPLTSTYDHEIMFVRKDVGDDDDDVCVNPLWGKAHTIRPGDHVLMPKINANTNTNIRMVTHTNNNNKNIQTLIAEQNYVTVTIKSKFGYFTELCAVKNLKNEISRTEQPYLSNSQLLNGKSPKSDKQYLYSSVSKVETYFDKKIVYDLTVEEDHSFVVGRSIVHNCHRIGQKNVVFAYYLIGNNTLDDHVANVLVDKSYEIDAIMDEKSESFENKEKAELILAQIHDKLKTKLADLL